MNCYCYYHITLQKGFLLAFNWDSKCFKQMLGYRNYIVDVV